MQEYTTILIQITFSILLICKNKKHLITITGIDIFPVKSVKQECKYLYFCFQKSFYL